MVGLHIINNYDRLGVWGVLLLLHFQKVSAKIHKSFELTKEYDKKSQNRHNNPHQRTFGGDSLFCEYVLYINSIVIDPYKLY